MLRCGLFILVHNLLTQFRSGSSLSFLIKLGEAFDLKKYNNAGLISPARGVSFNIVAWLVLISKTWASQVPFGQLIFFFLVILISKTLCNSDGVQVTREFL